MQHEETPKICYFFFKSDNAEQNDAVHAMQAILRQLLLQHRSLINVALSCLNENRLDSVQTLWNAFISVAEHPDTGDTICIIDGLDECEMGSRKQFANLISAHFSSTVSKAELTKSSRLKLLVASRPDTAFKIIFDRPVSQSETQSSRPSDKTKSQISMIRLRGEDETEAISDDVSVVIKSDISNLEYQGLPSEILADIQEQLIARADRTFLWVTLILQLLKERVEAGASRRELNEILQSRDIDDTYNQLLSGRPDAPRARKVLNLVLAAHRPLTLDELSIALAIEGEDHRQWSKRSSSKSLTNFDNIEDELVFPYENHIKSLCGHFVRIIRNCVYLVHETARHFLLARGKIPPSDSGSVPWQGSFETSEAREILLSVCVTFLYCLSRRSRCAIIGHASPRTAPFLDYAATYWPIHFEEMSCGTSFKREEIKYYYNLCHPSLLGFNEWAPKALKAPLEVILPETTGLSTDSTQDFCWDSLFSGRSVRGNDDKNQRSTKLDVRNSNFGALSSNPSALSNHHFPLTVDEYGGVRLDFSAGPQNKRS